MDGVLSMIVSYSVGGGRYTWWLAGFLHMIWDLGSEDFWSGGPMEVEWGAFEELGQDGGREALVSSSSS
jgi:hypothetical protein